MAIVFGKGSAYLHKRRTAFGYGILLSFLIVEGLIFSVRLLRPLPTSLFFIALLVIIFLVVYAIDTYRSVEKKFFNFDDGLFGENRVIKTLHDLPDEYFIFRNCQTQPNNDVDITVVGPTGIYAIEVKSHVGKIGFDGKHLTQNGHGFAEKDPISQILSATMSLHQYLLEKTGKNIFINPVVVFSSKHVSLRFGLHKQRGVNVIQRQWLLDLITKQPLQPTVGFDQVRDALKHLVLGQPNIPIPTAKPAV